MNQAVTGHQKINNINLYYEFYPKPSTQTVVLLHGFLSSTFTFRHLIPLLSQNFQVLSVDLPPFGKTEKSRRFIYSYKNMAATVNQLMEYFDLKDIILMGHSMGGQIALNILHFFPRIAQKAVLISSSSYLRRSSLPLIFASYIPCFHLFVKYWLSRTGVRKNLELTLFNHDLINDDVIKGYEEPFLQNGIFKALCRMIRHREGDLPSTVLNNIQTPCLLIWGEHDKAVPLNIGERLNNDLSNSQLIVMSKTGHAVPEERPQEIYQQVLNFLAKASV